MRVLNTRYWYAFMYSSLSQALGHSRLLHRRCPYHLNMHKALQWEEELWLANRFSSIQA